MKMLSIIFFATVSRWKRSLGDIIETTINRWTYDPNNLVEEVEVPRPGLFWASLLMFLLVPFSILKPLPQILPGQAPPGSPQPGLSFTGGASPNDLDHPEIGEALALVPDGHQPVGMISHKNVNKNIFCSKTYKAKISLRNLTFFTGNFQQFLILFHIWN